MTKNEFIASFVEKLAVAHFERYPDPDWYPDPSWLITRAQRLADDLERRGFFR